MILFISILYIICIAFLLFIAYSKKYFSKYTLAKAITSCGFIALGLACFFMGTKQNSIYAIWILLAFLLCCIGDICLGLANNKGKLFSQYFIRGVGAFMLAHILFSVAFLTISPFKLYDIILPIILAAATFLSAHFNLFKLKKMKIPAIIYSAFVGFMCMKGVSACFALSFNQKGILIAIGSILFLISDFIILFLYFYKNSRKFFRGANLLTYYIGILFLALSCIF